MSVGGKVVEVIAVSPSEVWVNTDDSKPPRQPNLCAVYVDPQGHSILPGDSLWWQGRSCYWTPRNNQHGETFGAFDLELPKIGFSGVCRPKGGSR